MKYILPFLFSLGFFALTFTASFAGNTVYKNVGETVTVSKTASNCTYGIINGDGCNANAASFNASKSCSSTISCTASGITVTDTSNVVINAPVTSMTVDGSTGGISSCPGVTHSLWWSSTNVSGGICGGFNYGPVGSSPSAGGSASFSATSNGTISYNCPNPDGLWGTQRDISISLLNQASCCGVGSQASQTIWTGYSCVAPTGSWTSNGDCPAYCGYSGGFAGTWSCTGGNGYCSGSSPSNSYCPATASCAVNGVCSSTHYSCSAGNSASNGASGGFWTWYCNGTNGGSNSGQCSELQPCTVSAGYASNNPPTCTARPTNVTLSVDDTYISYGAATTLRWGSTGASNCTASNGWSGTKGVSGSESTGNLASSATYALKCTNPGGDTVSTPASVTVNVCPAGTPTRYFGACVNVVPGVCNNAARNSCSAGTVNDAAVADTGGFYRWQCDGVGGGTSDSSCNFVQPCTVSAGYASDNPPTCTVRPTASLTANGANNITISYNTKANLAWGSAGSPTSCTAIGEWSNASNQFNGNGLTDALLTAKTYEFYCTNAGGNSSTVSATVNVCPSGTPYRVGGACVNVTGSITPNTCTIPDDSGLCNMNVQWTSSNSQIGIEIHRLYSPFGTVPGGTGVAGNIPLNFSPPGTYAFGIYDGSNKLGESNFVASCNAGSSWHPADKICLKNVDIGSLAADFGVSPSTIYSGDSSTLSWNNVAGGGIITCSITNNRNVTVWPAISTGGLRSTGAVTDDTIYTLTCVNGASTSTKMVSLNVIKGSLIMSAPSCEIPIGGSSCTVTATWTTQHTTDPKLVDRNMGTTLSSLATRGTPFTVNVGYDHTNFDLKNGSTLLDTKRVDITLPPNTGWNPLPLPGKVVELPAITLNPVFPKVSYGYPAEFTWSSSALDTTSCTENLIGPSMWSPGPAVAGTASTTNPVTSNPSTVSIACTGPAGTSTKNASVAVCAQATPVWISGSSCQAKPEATMVSSHNHTATGHIDVSCRYSSSYQLYRDGVLIPAESGSTLGNLGLFTKSIDVTTAGTYTFKCNYTSGDGHLFSTSAAVPFVFTTTPPDPIVSLKQTPASIAKGSATVISWTVMYPNSVQVPVRSACTLIAQAVCAGGVSSCTQAQKDEATRINNIITTEKTDGNDPGNVVAGGPRPIVDAVDQLVHPIILEDWRAFGKKTFTLDKSMDFKLDCGVGANAKSSVRVQVTSSNEG